MLMLLFLVIASVLSLATGSIEALDLQILRELRLPRLLTGLAVGMALAVSGAVLQSLFSNPLAEPYTLGISSGSALGAVIGISLFPGSWVGGAGMSFVGALVFASVLLIISFKKKAGSLALLLSGVMLGFLGSSLVALWMALADPSGVYAAVYWLMGDLSRARTESAAALLFVTVILYFLIHIHSSALDAFLTGEENARSVGIPVEQVRRRLLFLVSILIGLSVASSGMIGFIGLLIPHFVRRQTGVLHRHVLPLCAGWGAALLVLADVTGKRLAAPQELPVGVVTALVGVPVFLFFMMSERNTKYEPTS